MTDVPTPITVSASGTKAILIAIAGHALTAAGMLLVAKGFVTQGQVDAAIPGLTEQVVGLLITGASALWSAYRTKHANDKLVTVASAVSDHIAVTK